MTRVPRAGRTLRTVSAVALVAIVAAACSSSGSAGSSGDATNGTSHVSGTITVAAAASLSEAFTRIGRDVEHAHPGLHVRFDFDASSALATRLEGGAPADVFAAADETTVARVVRAGIVRESSTRVFARNRLEIVTKAGNPDGLRSLRDLRRVDIVALCGATVPCGRLADAVLARAGVVLGASHVTRAQNVKAALTAVADGDADAGVVYETDVRAAGKRVTGIPIPARDNATTSYPIATVRNRGNQGAAEAFVAAVLSRRGQRTLRTYGFAGP